MSAALVDGFNGLGGKSKGDSFLKLRHVNAFFLEIGVLANKPGRVKLGSASAV